MQFKHLFLQQQAGNILLDCRLNRDFIRLQVKSGSDKHRPGQASK
jgi:hypothetical protein